MSPAVVCASATSLVVERTSEISLAVYNELDSLAVLHERSAEVPNLLTSVAMDGSAKRRRQGNDEGFMQRLLNISGTSNQSLRKILEEVQAHKEDLNYSIRHAIGSAYHARFDEVACSVELPLKTGGSLTWTFAEPNLLLAKMIHECPALTWVYATALQETPPRQDAPWHLVVAWDEFAPGDKMHADNRRKSMVLSFCFRELGQSALCHEWAWCTPVVVRSTTIAQARGGWSSMLKHYLQLHLFGTHGLATAGVPLVINGRSYLLFAEIANLLTDGEGFQKALCWKGASSLKPCFLHDNIFKLNSDLAHRRPGFHEVDCDDPALFTKRSDEDLAIAWDLLAAAHARVVAGTMTKAAFARIEMMQGITYNPDGLLSDVALRHRIRVVETFTSDWVHDVLQDGVFTTEAWQFIKASGVRNEQLSSFLADDAWEFPYATRTKARGLYRVFDSFRASSSTEHDKLKCSASELLGLYGLVRFFFEAHVPREAALEAKRLSFDAACKVLDLILIAKRGLASPRAAAGPLLEACRAHLQLHKAAYGSWFIKPKHHWLLDIPPQMHRDNLIIDAFVIERNHLVVKAVAENVRNTSTFERSVLAGMLNAQFRKASDAMTGSADGSPLTSLHGRLCRVQHLDMAAHMSYLSLQVNESRSKQTIPHHS